MPSLFNPDDDIGPLLALVNELSSFGFVVFDKSNVTRIEGSGASKRFYYGVCCFIRKQTNTVLMWGGKSMKVEIPYFGGSVCIDRSLVHNAEQIIEQAGLWWVRCPPLCLNSASRGRTFTQALLEDGIARPIAFVGSSPKKKHAVFTATSVAFASETDAIVFGLRHPRLD